MRHRILLGLVLNLYWGSAQVTDRPSPIPWKKQRSTSSAQKSSAASVSQTRSHAAPANTTVKDGGETGLAMYYAPEMDGKLTANGEPVDSQALTAAHPYYPFGTRLRVTSLASGKTVIVRVNDRCPQRGRIITVTQRAAEELGFVKSGTTRVHLQVISDQKN